MSEPQGYWGESIPERAGESLVRKIYSFSVYLVSSMHLRQVRAWCI
jgi:hypothetical protein